MQMQGGRRVDMAVGRAGGRDAWRGEGCEEIGRAEWEAEVVVDGGEDGRWGGGRWRKWSRWGRETKSQKMAVVEVENAFALIPMLRTIHVLVFKCRIRNTFYIYLEE